MSITLLQGDCLEVMKNIPSKSIDMVFTDPPYGITACKWDTMIPLDPMWVELQRITKPTSAIILTANEPYTSLLICSNLKQFKYRWSWRKNRATGFLNAKKQPLRCIEDVCVFYSKQCKYNPQKTSGHKPVNSYTKSRDGSTLGETKAGISGGGQTDRYPTNCITHISVVNNDGSNEKKLHPTQKPVELAEYFIKTYTNENDVVLNFAMGSGTTGIACKRTNRSFIGIELDSYYFKIAKNRIESEIT